MAYEVGGFHLTTAILCLLCALFIQIGTNFWNDYADFTRGADTSRRKGPLRVTQAGLVTRRQILMATVLVFGLSILACVYPIVRGGWVIAVIGTLSILAGILYTGGKYPLGYLGLGDVLVLIFYGPVAVAGTFYVQTLEINATVIVVGFASGLMATAILVVNNVRDFEEDRSTGKKTLVVRFGRRFGVVLWGLCVVVAALIPLEIVVATGNHRWAAWTLIVLIPAMAILRRLISEQEPERLNPLLGKTGLLLLVHSMIFSVGWIFS